MRAFLRRHWPSLKVLLGVAVVAAVGTQFYRLLAQPELHAGPVELPWAALVETSALYLAGLACWGAFWARLMRAQCEPLTWPRAARAYFVSQLGKYVPGKALAIVLRATLLR